MDDLLLDDLLLDDLLLEDLLLDDLLFGVMETTEDWFGEVGVSSESSSLIAFNIPTLRESSNILLNWVSLGSIKFSKISKLSKGSKFSRL